MRNTTIQKINRFGKIGRVILTVLIVLTIIATVAVTAATVIIGTLPKDAVTVSVSSNAKITVKAGWFNALWDAVVDGVSYASDDGTISFVPPEDTPLQVNFKLFGTDCSSATIHSDGSQKIIDASTDAFVYELRHLVIVLAAGIVFLLSVTGAMWTLKRLFRGFESCETPFCEDIVKKIRCFGFSLIPVAVLSSVCETVVRSLLAASQEVDVYVDWGVVIAFAVTVCLGTVFKYGVQLQRESDETL